MSLKLILHTVLWLTLYTASTSPEEYVHECVVWKKEAERVMQEPRLNVNCEKNSQCTGFDCNGQYSYKGPLTNNSNYTKNICFGLWIRPCERDLQLYFEQQSDKVSFTKTVKKDGKTMVDIPGLKEKVKYGNYNLVTATVTLEIDLNHLVIHSNQYMTIGVTLKPKVNYGGVYSEYPEDMKVELVKDVSVPVPSCNKDILPPKHVPGKCADKTAPANTPKPILVHCTPQEKKLCTSSGCQCLNITFLKSCNTKMYACPNNQGCFLHDSSSKKYYCDCLQDFERDVNNTCVPSVKTTEIIAILDDDTSSDASSTSKKNVIIIATCSVGAIILAMVATAFVVWRYLKHRSRYSNHSLLRNEDDDYENDVPPINLEA